MIPNFRAAMFDMDGTVLHSMRYWRLTAIELLLGYNIIPTPEQLGRVFSSSSRKLCREILAEHGIHKDQWQILRELEVYMYPHYQREVKEKSGVGEYLRGLKAAGIPICIATAAPKAYAREVLERLELIQYFDFITDCYEEEMRKDDPEFFRRMARRMNVNAEEMCVFEDALYSMRGAKAAGCPLIAVQDAMQAHDEQVIRGIADHWIADFRELL